MILDEHLEFCDAEDVSAAMGTEVIASAIDLQAAGVRLGVGAPALYLVINVSADFASAGAATVQFRLVSDSTDPASSDGSETRHWSSQAFDYTDLTAASKPIVVPLPGPLPEYERYLQLQVVTAAATTTAGSINAFLTMNPAQWFHYPEANS